MFDELNVVSAVGFESFDWLERRSELRKGESRDARGGQAHAREQFLNVTCQGLP